jgi:hypothetical protein
MSLWRRRQDYSDSLIRDAFIVLTPIALMLTTFLLWFLG